MRLVGLFLVLGLVLTVVAAACGEDEDEATPEPAAVTQPAPATAVPATAVPKAVATEVPEVMMAKFGESPTLAALVAAGKLPPVEERLPENPLVIDVVEQIGTYGGTIRRIYNGARDHCNYSRPVREGLFRWSTDGFTLNPALAESWDTPDGKTWTVKIRKGVKWNDGAPLTADDFVYTFEDVVKNEELNTGSFPKWITVAGQNGEVEKVDDFTVKFIFPVSNFVWPNAASEEPCASGGFGYVFAPKHYLGQFLPKYADGGEAALNKMAQDDGFETWVELYNRRNAEKWNPDRPTTRAWVLQNEFGSALLTAERNPYFYAVDPEGNQLPYVDKMTWELVEDSEVIQVKVAAGEVDFQGRRVKFATYPVLKQNEVKSKFRVMEWARAGGGVENALFMNQNFDGEVGDLLRNVDFRRALSMAINRDEIIEIIYLGLGEGRNALPGPGHPHDPGQEWVKKWTEYDTAKANQMLDAILPDKDGEGFRKLANGDRLLLIITTQDGGVKEAELVANDWEAVGVKVKVDSVVRATLTTRNNGGEYHVITWGVDTGCCLFSEPNKTLPVTSATHLPVWGTRYAAWKISGGTEGTEPPDVVKKLQEQFLKGQTLPASESNEIAKEIYRVTADNQYIIGLVGLVPKPFVVKTDLRNVPEFAAQDWPLRGPSTAYPEQFFWSTIP